MHCPLKTAKYINPKDEECSIDCTWLVGDKSGNLACAVPALIEVLSGGSLVCQNYYERKDVEEDEDVIGE